MDSEIEILKKKLCSTSSASSTCSESSTTSSDSGLEKSCSEINEKIEKYFNKKIIDDENIRRKVSVESKTSTLESIDSSSSSSSSDYEQQIDSDDLLSNNLNDISNSFCKFKLSTKHDESDESESDDDDDDDLQEKGPVRSQMVYSRQQPYNNFYDNNSFDAEQIDLDIAQKIYSNSQYCCVINASLDKLTNCQQTQESLTNNYLSVNNSCQFDNNINEINNNGVEEKYEFDGPLNDILNSYQQAQPETINYQNSSPSTSSENWPDSPVSSNYFQQTSNSQSYTSSRPHTPLSLINMDSPNTTINLSNTSSPIQRKLNYYHCNYRKTPQSSSSSSNYSQCDTPSPKNYQNLIDNQNDEEKFDNFQQSTWYENCETTNNINDKLKIININNNYIDNNNNDNNYEKNHECDIKNLNDIKLEYKYKDYNNLSTIDNNYNNTENNNFNYDNDFDNFLTNQIDINHLDNVIDDLEIKTEDIISTNYLNNQYNIVNNNNTLYNDNYHSLTTQTNMSELKINQQQQQKWYDENNKKLFNNFQIPKPMKQQKQYKTMKQKKNKYDPWKSLSMPKISSSKILKSKLNDCDVARAMKDLLQVSIQELSRADDDGYTKLMCLVGNPIEFNKKKEFLVPLVERLSMIHDGLTKMNNYGQDALYIASINYPKMYYVAGYLAGVMVDKGIDISRPIYTKGNNLIHELAKKGDAYKPVLIELLSLKTIEGKSVFDLSKCNFDGKTPLHVAVEAHDPSKRGTSTIEIIRLFIERGCDCKIREYTNGNTALHIAISKNCDPILVQALLEKNGCDAVNIQNKNNNTPLHMIALLSDELSLNIQSNICMQLIKTGAQTNVKNNNGQLPLTIVTTKRKEFIQKIFHES
ncbi:GATA zinc finger domain-containing protein 14-like [Aphidius gifuensis]|nr:GATA zinc finger domain-containing protein 14-like [Aphidius gifuensis]